MWEGSVGSENIDQLIKDIKVFQKQAENKTILRCIILISVSSFISTFSQVGNAKTSSLGHYIYFYVPLNFKAYIQMALLVLLYAFPLNLKSWLVSTNISKQQTCLHFQNSFTTLVRDPQNICHSVLLLFFSLPTSLKGHLTPASFSSSLHTPCLAFTVLALPYPLA